MSEEETFIDVLEAVFAAVVAKARTDRAFARQLAKAVAEPGKLAAAARRAPDWREEAPDLDLAALFEAKGADAARRVLRPLTRRQLYALVRARNLSPSQTSRLNKAQLIEHIARTLARSRTPAKRVFDY
jgi:hypothetical protein